MAETIQLELLMTLKQYQPDSHHAYPIGPGVTVRELLERLKIPEYEVNLVFINGEKGNLNSSLKGGERVALFPPLGGG
jgi:molybdopterin converting factor small subunit